MLAISETAADLHAGDIGDYLSARNLAAELDAPGVMEYWKSTPYMLSFMDRYRLSDRLRNAAQEGQNGDVARIVGSSSREFNFHAGALLTGSLSPVGTGACVH